MTLPWLKEMGYAPEQYAPPTRAGKKNRRGKACCYCGASNKKYTREHVHPKSQGGTFTLPCCRNCNQFKGALTLADFRRKLATMLKNVEELRASQGDRI